MTQRAGIGNLVFVRHRRRDECEGVGAHFHVAQCRLDLGHVAIDALAARRAVLVAGVFFDRGGARAVERQRRVTVETEFVRRLYQLSIVRRAMRVVAGEAREAVLIHEALDEVVSLHAILVSGAVGIMREGRGSERVLLELPEVPQFEAHLVTNRPVVVLVFDGIGPGAAF